MRAHKKIRARSLTNICARTYVTAHKHARTRARMARTSVLAACLAVHARMRSLVAFLAAFFWQYARTYLRNMCAPLPREHTRTAHAHARTRAPLRACARVCAAVRSGVCAPPPRKPLCSIRLVSRARTRMHAHRVEADGDEAALRITASPWPGCLITDCSQRLAAVRRRLYEVGRRVHGGWVSRRAHATLETRFSTGDAMVALGTRLVAQLRLDCTIVSRVVNCVSSAQLRLECSIASRVLNCVSSAQLRLECTIASRVHNCVSSAQLRLECTIASRVLYRTGDTIAPQCHI
jgi:hypothetical protein